MDLENEQISKRHERHDKSIKHKRVTKSGRITKTPYKLMTTSSDEAPARKRLSKTSVTVNKELIRLQSIANAIKNKYNTESTSTKMAEAKLSKVACSNLVVTPVDNSTSLPPISAPERTGQTEPVPPVRNFDSNAEDVALPDESHAGKTIQNKSPATITASFSNRVSPKTDLTSRFGNAAGTSKYRDFDSSQSIESSRMIQERTSDNLQELLKTVLSIKQQNLKIIENQKEMKLQLDNIEEKIGQKDFRGAQLSQDTLYQPLKGFPLSTIDHFEKLESDEQKNTRQQLYQHLLTLGGSKLREFLHCAMKEVMIDKLVCEFSWLGDKKTKKFGNTKISNVLFEAAKSCPFFEGPETKAQYKKEIQEILRCTKQRYRNQLKKVDEPESEDPDTDREYDTIVKEINQLKQYLDDEQNSSDADSEEESSLNETFDEDKEN